MSAQNPPVATVEKIAAPSSLRSTDVRVASVDVLRGLVITLMIFVNDVAGVARAPAWLKHVDATADAMTLPDVVFPAFLFIAGVSIPLAFERARAQGRTTGELLMKVLTRAGALLLMGVIMANIEEHNPWWRGAWGVLAYGAMFLAFAVVPRASGTARTVLRAGQFAGAAALVALALTYTTGAGRHMLLGPWFDPADTVWLRHSWWGILGLIGWAYAMSAGVYLLAWRRREWLVGATACLMLLYVADDFDLGAQVASHEWLGWAAPLIAALRAGCGWIDGHVSFGSSLGSLAAIVMAGCCLGSILTSDSGVRSPTERLRWALTFAAGLFFAGLFLDAPYGVNKIRATPAWCLYSSALTVGAWMALYWLIDVRGKQTWGRWVQPAGANPLLAYLLHPFLYYLAALVGLPLAFYKSGALPVVVAVAGSLIMAVLVVRLTEWVVRLGYRLKV